MNGTKLMSFPRKKGVYKNKPKVKTKLTKQPFFKNQQLHPNELWQLHCGELTTDSLYGFHCLNIALVKLVFK